MLNFPYCWADGDAVDKDIGECGGTKWVSKRPKALFLKKKTEVLSDSSSKAFYRSKVTVPVQLNLLELTGMWWQQRYTMKHLFITFYAGKEVYWKWNVSTISRNRLNLNEKKTYEICSCSVRNTLKIETKNIPKPFKLAARKSSSIIQQLFINQFAAIYSHLLCL